MKEQKSSILIRSLLFIFFLLTVLFTLLSGVGTYCAAFDTEKYPSMMALLPYQLLYQILFFISVIVGLLGFWVSISFIRNTANVYRNIILILSIGLVGGAVQMIASEIIRGDSVPVNFRVYFTLFTLLLFLIVRYTPLWKRSGFSKLNKKENIGKIVIGAALVIGGIGVLTTQIWVGSSHFAENGYNWVNDLKMPLYVFGSGMLIFGSVLLLFSMKWNVLNANVWILRYFSQKDTSIN